MAKACIFNIQRFSTHDGPGIRTTVFFKGCNLRCAWCHNPESLAPNPTLEFNPDLCIACGRCAEVCPAGVHEKGRPAMHRNQCLGCGRCARECFAGALTLAGKELTEEQIMQEILTDRPYYMQSGGGVTFSGGECMLQIDFLENACRMCREYDIHIAIDTAGHVPWHSFERVLPFAPLFLYDLKAMNPGIHRRLTGAENGRILENLERLLGSGARVWIRIPCVPGANDDELGKIAEWLQDRPVERVELLAYHRLGSGKRRLLGLETGDEFRVPEKQEMQTWLSMMIQHSIPARIR